MDSGQAGAEELDVGVLIYDGVNILDCGGPFETLLMAADQQPAASAASPRGLRMRVFTIAPSAPPVKAGSKSGALCLFPDYTFATHPPIQVLIVPGAQADDWQTIPAFSDPAVVAWLDSVTKQTRINSSVCTGAFLLGQTDGGRLFSGRTVTTHWLALQSLQDRYPQAQVIPRGAATAPLDDRHMPTLRWVDDGNLVTSAGVSAGIDMSLRLVARFWGAAFAHRIAGLMQYKWEETQGVITGHTTHAHTAPPAVPASDDKP